MINKSIIWEKWRDPFLGYDDNEIDVENLGFDNDLDDEDNDSEYDGEIRNNFKKINNTPVKAITTPMGIIPYNEYTASSSIFNFWIGHTNFDIDIRAAKLIENTAGVETLDIFTRYRFRIGIGKAFEDREVMKLIESNICQPT